MLALILFWFEGGAALLSENANVRFMLDSNKSSYLDSYRTLMCTFATTMIISLLNPNFNFGKVLNICLELKIS